MTAVSSRYIECYFLLFLDSTHFILKWFTFEWILPKLTVNPFSVTFPDPIYSGNRLNGVGQLCVAPATSSSPAVFAGCSANIISPACSKCSLGFLLNLPVGSAWDISSGGCSGGNHWENLPTLLYMGLTGSCLRAGEHPDPSTLVPGHALLPRRDFLKMC